MCSDINVYQPVMSPQTDMLLRGADVFNDVRNQINEYIANNMYNYLVDGNIPEWTDRLLESNLYDLFDEIMYNTLASEDDDMMTVNEGSFVLPTVTNAHGYLLEYMLYYGRLIDADYVIPDIALINGSWACIGYAYFWCKNHTDILHKKLLLNRKKYIAAEFANENGCDDDMDD